jgi:hypothetical protein
MELRNLIDTHLDLPRLSKDLDECGHFARMWSVSRWTREDQAKVFEAAKGFRPVTLEDFVPSSVPPRTEVTHIGKNTLPPPLTHVEKRFFRPAKEGAGDVIVGRNYNPFEAFSGPGFFVGRLAAEAGEVDLDYTLTPVETLDSFGAIKSNEGGISTFVFAGLVDVMRGISSHVTIGRGKKKGVYIDNWFVIVREDPPQAPAS